MAEKRVDQPVSSEPTNKVTASVLASGAMAVVYYILQAVAPTLPNDQLIVGITPIVIWAAGWFTRDSANVRVIPSA